MIKAKVLLSIIFILLTYKISGQILKFKEAVKLSSSINSEAEESMPIVSSDGNTMYFVRSFYKDNHGGKFAGQDVWMSKKDSSWSLATNQLKYINNKKNNAVAGIKEDGKTLYLLDSYGGTVHGIAFTKYINNKWTKPENIPIKGINKEGYIGFYMSPSYDVLLISMAGSDSYGKEDIYVSLKDSSNRWSVPHNLGATINSSGFEISPFLSNDKKYLFFASNGHPGFGDADIFVSERLYNSWDLWSAPKNLGPEINSQNFDAFFTLASDSTVYFSSNRGNDNADIYQSFIVTNNINISKAHIDSLIEEAKHLVNELKVINSHRRQELIVSFNYNSFELSKTNKETILSFLNKINSKDNLSISLIPFSWEEYSTESERLISNKRVSKVKEYLEANGISALEISVKNYVDLEYLKQLKKDHIGGLKIIFNL